MEKALQKPRQTLMRKSLKLMPISENNLMQKSVPDCFLQTEKNMRRPGRKAVMRCG
jgi:hypothetical protein